MAILLIVALTLAVSGCSSGSSSNNSNSGTSTPTVEPSNSATGTLTATQAPVTTAPTISASDPASYKVYVNTGANPDLYFDVGVDNYSVLSSLTTYWTDDGGTPTSRTDYAKDIISTRAKGLAYRIKIGPAAKANVTMIAKYNDGASRTVIAMHLVNSAAGMTWTPY